MEIGGTTRPA
jgi:hypothetical protein